jgi:hypothetical protein
VCLSQLRNAQLPILFVLVIKLTKETRQDRDGGFWEGGLRDWDIGEAEIEEGECEQAFHCLTWKTCWFTVPPAIALLYYISKGILWRIFCQTGFFAGFSLHIITVKSPNVVWGLVVIGDIKILFGPAQFICKVRWFFQKQSLHYKIFCFGYLYCKSWLY